MTSASSPLAGHDSDGRHDCPKVGCPERLEFEVLACRPHWFQIPPTLRARLSVAWRQGNLELYMSLRDQAVAALNG